MSSSGGAGGSSSCILSARVDGVQLAQQYGRQSNAHDLQGIAGSLSEEPCLYGQQGKDAILRFMRAFRVEHPNVCWRFLSFEPLTEAPERVDRQYEKSCALVMRFERYWTDATGSTIYKTTASERLEFTAEGRLHRIGYCQRISEATVVEDYPRGVQPVPFEL